MVKKRKDRLEVDVASTTVDINSKTICVSAILIDAIMRTQM